MAKKWYAREIWEGNKITKEFEFQTEAEAKAFVAGYTEAKETSANSGEDDWLEEFSAMASDESSDNYPID